MRLFLIILCLGCWSVLPAQVVQDSSHYVPYMYLNLNPQIGLPVNHFQDRMDRTGWGFGSYFAIQLFRSPVFAGFDWSYQIFADEALEFTEIVDGESRDYKLTTRSNLMNWHLFLRFQPEVNFPVWPYVDALVGTKHLYTRTRFTEDLGGGETDILEGETDLSDWAFSYGGAAGLQIPLNYSQSILLDVRCAYLIGANAEYYTPLENTAGLNIEDSLDYFEKRSSATTMILPQIGVTVELYSLFLDLE